MLWNRNYFLRFRFRFRLLKSYGSGSDFLTSYGSGSGFTRQKVTVPVPVPQHWQKVQQIRKIFFLVSILEVTDEKSRIRSQILQVHGSKNQNPDMYQNVTYGIRNTDYKYLKVGTNEKWGGSQRWQMIGVHLGLWWSMSFCLLIWLPSCIKSVSSSAYSSPIIIRWPTN